MFDGFVEVSGGACGGDVGGGVVVVLGGGEVSDYCLGVGDRVEAAGVGGGEVQAVEDGAAVLEVDHVGGDGVDNLGDGDLDGDGVFEGAEVEDGSAALEVGAGGDGVAVDAVALVEAVVEVAEDRGLEGYGLALEAVGADVSADRDLHGGSFRGGYPCL